MKAVKFLQIITFSILTMAVVSCVEDNEYDVPPTATQVEPNVTVNSSIQAIKSTLDQHFESVGESIIKIDEDSGLVLSGYVVSSDLAGNFFKSIVLQDSPSNPSGGIEILIDKPSLFEIFEFGRKVYVKMAGLSISYEDGDDNVPFGLTAAGSFSSDTNPGRYTVGVDDGGFGLNEIPQFSYLESVLRSTEIVEIVPTPVSPLEFSEEHINTFIQLTDIQFVKTEIGKTFAGETNDQFDGFRNIFSCAEESTVLLQTSTFADFKSYTLPSEVGTLNAVLAKDFRADFFVLIANSPTDIDFTNSQRCDPVALDCGTGIVGGPQNIFEQDFDSTSEAQLEIDGWVNENINGGSELFSLKSSGGTSHMEASAFNSDENPMEVWLITPAINLDSTTDEELTFESKAGYYNGDALSVYISTDFAGDVKRATWDLIESVDLPTGPTSGYGNSFTPSGSINISCLVGDVYIAFKYSGSSSIVTTTFRINNVKVTGN